VFQLYCGFDFHNKDLHLAYAPDVYTCADYCAKWNLNVCNTPCLGATLDVGTPGPSGSSLAGYECWLKFDMSGPPDPRNNASLVGVSTTAVNGVKMTTGSVNAIVSARFVTIN